MDNHWFFQPSDFLKKMTLSDKEELLSQATLTHFQKDGYIFKAGDPGEYVYIVEDGRVKIWQLSADGREIILWFCLPGEMFGIAELPRESISARPVTAQACVDSHVYAIPQNVFNAFLKNHPETSMLVIELLSRRLRILGNMLLNSSSDDVTSRIIKLILRLSAHEGKQNDVDVCLELPMTHQEIADMVGASRQTVTSVIGGLRRKGVLEMIQQRIRIIDQKQLNMMIASLA